MLNIELTIYTAKISSFAISLVSCPILIWFINWNKGLITVALKIPIYILNLILKKLSHIVLDLGYNIQLLENRSDNGFYCFQWQ